MLLVLKALAGALDLSLGDLLEGIVLHAFEGKAPFGPDALAKIEALREVYSSTSPPPTLTCSSSRPAARSRSELHSRA